MLYGLSLLGHGGALHKATNRRRPGQVNYNTDGCDRFENFLAEYWPLPVSVKSVVVSEHTLTITYKASVFIGGRHNVSYSED